MAYGPAAAVDGKLKIAEIPARATFPITVKVVACQFGRGVAPLMQTAEPVGQTIRIEEQDAGRRGVTAPFSEPRP